MALSTPQWLDVESLQKEVQADVNLQPIVEALKIDHAAHPPYNLIGGRLYYKGRLVIPTSSSWIPLLLEEFHSTPSGGHSGALRTYRRLATSLYWQHMFKSVKEFVASCLVCQRTKYEALSPAGLLQPLLPIPDRIWEDSVNGFHHRTAQVARF